MLKLRRPRIRSSNFMGDTCIVKFKNEFQVNVKQADTSYGTATLVPGTWLPDIQIPTLAQYVALYNDCRIVKTTVRVTFTNIEESYSKSVGITQLPTGETAPVTPSATILFSEQPRTRSAYLGPLSSSRSVRTLMNTGSARTAAGTSIPMTNGGTVLSTADLTTTPTGFDLGHYYFNVWTQNNLAFGTTEVDGTDMRIQTYYTIQFMDRKQVTA